MIFYNGEVEYSNGLKTTLEKLTIWDVKYWVECLDTKEEIQPVSITFRKALGPPKHKGATEAVLRNLHKPRGMWDEVWEGLQYGSLKDFRESAERWLKEHSNLRNVTLDRADWESIYEEIKAKKEERDNG